MDAVNGDLDERPDQKVGIKFEKSKNICSVREVEVERVKNWTRLKS